MPSWPEDPNRSRGLRVGYHRAPLPPIGKVIQKELNPWTLQQHWREGIHQNLLFIGHGRQGAGSAKRAAKKAAARQRSGRIDLRDL